MAHGAKTRMGAWGACPAAQYAQAVGFLLLPTIDGTTCMAYPGLRESQPPLPMNPPHGGLVAPKDGNHCFGTCLAPELGMSERERLALPPTSPPNICQSAWMLAWPRTCWVMLRAMAECRILTVNLVT